MDVRAQEHSTERPPEGRRTRLRPRRLSPGIRDEAQWVGELLGQWRVYEVRLSATYRECYGLDRDQLEDLYGEVTLEMLARRHFKSELHLQRSLRQALKLRAKRTHRDAKTHRALLEANAARIGSGAARVDGQDGAEAVALGRQDRLIAWEFMTELTPQEQPVFALLSEEMSWRAIATRLQIPENEARTLTRACERKRKRFQLLYNSGRLCGFRSETIKALQSGETTSLELARSAFAHLDSCPLCRAENKTNASLLRARFQEQILVLLPLPALAKPLGWLQRTNIRARLLLYRHASSLPPGGPGGGVRERVAALAASGGAAVKVAVGVATIAAVAGTSIATHVLSPHPAHTRAHAAVLAPAATPTNSASSASASHAPLLTTGARRHASKTASRTAGRQYEPGGFAYLGVPENKRHQEPERPAAPQETGTPEPAAPVASEPAARPEAPPVKASEQHGGGPFGP